MCVCLCLHNVDQFVLVFLNELNHLIMGVASKVS